MATNYGNDYENGKFTVLMLRSGMQVVSPTPDGFKWGPHGYEAKVAFVLPLDGKPYGVEEMAVTEAAIEARYVVTYKQMQERFVH